MITFHTLNLFSAKYTPTTEVARRMQIQDAIGNLNLYQVTVGCLNLMNIQSEDTSDAYLLIQHLEVHIVQRFANGYFRNNDVMRTIKQANYCSAI